MSRQQTVHTYVLFTSYDWWLRKGHYDLTSYTHMHMYMHYTCIRSTYVTRTVQPKRYNANASCELAPYLTWRKDKCFWHWKLPVNVHLASTLTNVHPQLSTQLITTTKYYITWSQSLIMHCVYNTCRLVIRSCTSSVHVLYTSIIHVSSSINKKQFVMYKSVFLHHTVKN